MTRNTNIIITIAISIISFFGMSTTAEARVENEAIVAVEYSDCEELNFDVNGILDDTELKSINNNEETQMTAEEMFNKIEVKAEMEDAHAQYELYNCYMTGNGVKKNTTEALKWLLKAVDNGCKEAQQKAVELMKSGALNLK